MRKGILVMLLIGAAFTAQGADSGGKFAVKGAGAASCEAYNQSVRDKSPQFYQFAGWLNGYLTANNRFLEKTYDLVPWQSNGLLQVMLFNHCEKNPKQPYYAAVTAMIGSMMKERIQQRGELVLASNEGKTRPIYRSELLRVQQALVAEKLLHKSKVSGSYDEATKTALMAYQRKNKVGPSGLPDDATLMRLFAPAKKAN